MNRGIECHGPADRKNTKKKKRVVQVFQSTDSFNFTKRYL